MNEPAYMHVYCRPWWLAPFLGGGGGAAVTPNAVARLSNAPKSRFAGNPVGRAGGADITGGGGGGGIGAAFRPDAPLVTPSATPKAAARLLIAPRSRPAGNPAAEVAATVGAAGIIGTGAVGAEGAVGIMGTGSWRTGSLSTGGATAALGLAIMSFGCTTTATSCPGPSVSGGAPRHASIVARFPVCQQVLIIFLAKSPPGMKKISV